MPGMAVREFECTLCQQPFRLLSGDFFLPEPNVCDDCLRQVWELEREALEEHVAECLAGRETFPAGDIVRHIDWHQ